MKPGLPTRLMQYFNTANSGDTNLAIRQDHGRVEMNLVELITDGVFIAQDYRFIYADPALLDMLGYTTGPGWAAAPSRREL